MKKGDTVAHNSELPIGYVLYRGATTREKLDNWMTQSCEKTYGQRPEYDAVLDTENLGTYMAILKSPITRVLEAIVNWVFEDEMAISYKDGLSSIIDLTIDKDWYVLFEGEPEFQSSVEHMSDEQLRESITGLRNSRSSIKPTRTSRPKVVKVKVDNSPLAKALAGLDEPARNALKKKLGLVD